jgi:hypothetical protein
VDRFAILCKSYLHDLERCSRLMDSVRRHNVDSVPVYLCVPQDDRLRFEARIGRQGVTYLSDEDVTRQAGPQSWVSQQLVKLGFARAELAENYLWIDSDFEIVRDFCEGEFFAYDGIPCTVVSEARRDPFLARFLGGDPGDIECTKMLEGVFDSYRKIRDWFGRRGPLFFFGAPAIWSTRVVRALEDHVLARGLDFRAMLALAPYELCWYGEFLLRERTIPLVPRSGLSLCFTRDEQYRRFLTAGFTLDEFARAGYLAVNFASKWMSQPSAAAEPLRIQRSPTRRLATRPR